MPLKPARESGRAL